MRCVVLLLDVEPRTTTADDGWGRALVRLVAHLQDYGRITVVTWTDAAATVRAVVPDDLAVEVVGVDAPDGALDHLLDGGGDADRALGVADHDLLVLDGAVVTSPLALAYAADDAGPGTRMLARPAGNTAGPALRTGRGRVVAAGSSLHDATGADMASLGVVRIAASDRPALAGVVADLRRVIAGRQPGEQPSDVAALTTVGLVRHGVRVAATVLPEDLVWERSAASGEVDALIARADGVDEEAVRLGAAVKAEDGFFTTFFVSPYSRYLARFAARVGFTPDQVTVASMLVGLAAAGAFAVGTRGWAIAGALLLQAAFTLDCIDGQLARYTRRMTPLGAWLDAVFDRGKEVVVYAGLAAGAVRVGDDETVWLLAAGALALQVVRHMVDFGYAAQQHADLAASARGSLDVDEPEPSHWDRAAPLASGERHAARATVLALRRAEGVAALKWAKRIVVLPIGERFALISVLAATTTPRTVFITLLAWGALAALYTTSGRLVRSFA